jgi:Flp pilus assembly protein TadD
MIVRYLRLVVWPRGLVLDYGEPLHLTLSQTAPNVAFVVALLIVTAVALVRWPTLGFLGAWFFLTLAPTSSVIPISTEVGAERRMYLPLMGLVVLALALVARAVTVRHPRKQSARGIPHERAIYALTCVVALLLAVATVQRNAEYLSGLTLWQTVLDRWPPHARAHRNLAAELKLAGRREEEIDHLRAAVNDLPEIRNLLGVELLSLGKVDEGIAELRRFVRERPTDATVADAQAAVASALMTREDYEGARVEYAELLKSRPRDADAWSNLGIALAALHRTPEATSAFERAVNIDPDNSLSQSNLALHLLDQNDFDGAVAHARAALRITPNDAAAHNLLGLALAGQQKLDEAIAEFRASLALQPADNDATGYLQRTLRLRGR